jgi:hypothetical protein
LPEPGCKRDDRIGPGSANNKAQKTIKTTA